MMNKFFIMVVTCLSISCNAFEKKDDGHSAATEINTISSRIKRLKEAFEKEDYTTFFELFPDTYIEFVAYYGFEERTGAKPLYAIYVTHIDYLFEYSDKVSSEIFVKKIINIAKGGNWDADAVGLFQTHLHELIIKNPNIFFEILEAMPDIESARFWYFVIDSPHPNNSQNIEIVAILSKTFGDRNKQVLLLNQQFERVKEDEKH